VKTKRGIRETLNGSEGELSSKRVLMFMSFLVMIAMAYSAIFLEKNVPEYLFEGFSFIVMTTVCSVASEKFAKRYMDRRRSKTYSEEHFYTDNSVTELDEPDGSEYSGNVSRWEE